MSSPQRVAFLLRSQRLLLASGTNDRVLATLPLHARIGLVLPRAWYRVGLATQGCGANERDLD